MSQLNLSASILKVWKQKVSTRTEARYASGVYFLDGFCETFRLSKPNYETESIKDDMHMARVVVNEIRGESEYETTITQAKSKAALSWFKKAYEVIGLTSDDYDVLEKKVQELYEKVIAEGQWKDTEVHCPVCKQKCELKNVEQHFGECHEKSVASIQIKCLLCRASFGVNAYNAHAHDCYSRNLENRMFQCCYCGFGGECAKSKCIMD